MGNALKRVCCVINKPVIGTEADQKIVLRRTTSVSDIQTHQNNQGEL